MNRLPSEIEYEKLRQSYQILEDQFKQSNQTIIEYRKEKNHLKKQLLTHQHTIDQQKQTIKSQELSSDKSLLNAKCLTIDERIDRDQKFEELNRIIQQLNIKLNEEILHRKQDQHLIDNNVKTLHSLTNDMAKKEQTIKEMTSLLRQVDIFDRLSFLNSRGFLLESTRTS
jgi:chromosome segregation ATPase